MSMSAMIARARNSMSAKVDAARGGMASARSAATNFFSGPPPMAPPKRPDMDFWVQAKAKALSAPPPPQRHRAGSVLTEAGAPRSGGQVLPPRSIGLDPRRRPLITEDVHNTLLGLNAPSQ